MRSKRRAARPSGWRRSSPSVPNTGPFTKTDRGKKTSSARFTRGVCPAYLGLRARVPGAASAEKREGYVRRAAHVERARYGLSLLREAATSDHAAGGASLSQERAVVARH